MTIRRTNQLESSCKLCREVIEPGEGNIIKVLGPKICGMRHMEWRSTHKKCNVEEKKNVQA